MERCIYCQGELDQAAKRCQQCGRTQLVPRTEQARAKDTSETGSLVKEPSSQDSPHEVMPPIAAIRQEELLHAQSSPPNKATMKLEPNAAHASSPARAALTPGKSEELLHEPRTITEKAEIRSKEEDTQNILTPVAAAPPQNAISMGPLPDAAIGGEAHLQKRSSTAKNEQSGVAGSAQTEEKVEEDSPREAFNKQWARRAFLEDVNLKVGIQQEGIMPKEQRTFTKEFKVEAVHLVQTSGKSQSQVARDLGIADSTLHHWCKECSQAGEKAFVGSGNPRAGEEEIRRLKRELEVTRQERDILKKRSCRKATPMSMKMGYTLEWREAQRSRPTQWSRKPVKKAG